MRVYRNGPDQLPRRVRLHPEWGGENRTGSGDWSARASRGSLVTVVIRSSEVDVGNCEADALSLDQLGQSRYLIQTEMADYNGNIYKRKRKIYCKYAY